MKNLTLLNKKCAGWKPSALATYVKKCDHTTHMEKEFADLLISALGFITDTTQPDKKVFLYNEPKNTWTPETTEAYEKADKVDFSGSDSNAFISLKMFKPEENYVYFLLEAKQGGEEVELLFLEEMR